MAALRSAGLPEATGTSSTCVSARSTGAVPASTVARARLSKRGESAERLFAVAAWREAPYFTDAERAALAPAEAATRISDRSNPVPDEIWAEAAAHYTEQELAALGPVDRYREPVQPG